MNHETYTALQRIKRFELKQIKALDFQEHLKRLLATQIVELVLEHGKFVTIIEEYVPQWDSIEFRAQMTVVDLEKYKRICEEIKRQNVCYVDDKGQKQWLSDLL